MSFGTKNGGKWTSRRSVGLKQTATGPGSVRTHRIGSQKRGYCMTSLSRAMRRRAAQSGATRAAI